MFFPNKRNQFFHVVNFDGTIHIDVQIHGEAGVFTVLFQIIPGNRNGLIGQQIIEVNGGIIRDHSVTAVHEAIRADFVLYEERIVYETDVLESQIADQTDVLGKMRLTHRRN